MGASSGSTAGSGITRAHTWGVIVPLVCVLSVPYLSKISHVTNTQPWNALVAGVISGAAAYMLFKALDEKTHVLAKAVLSGLLIAEIMVLKPYGAIPTMSTITLWLFFYYHTMEGL
jgi:hypothetical protein